MKIENPNKEFKPISLIIENQTDLDRIKEILDFAEKGIGKTEYVFREVELFSYIKNMKENLK